MKYNVKFTSAFKKDLKLLKKQHKDLEKLYSVIELLANGVTLNEKYRDHILTGDLNGVHDCHIEPDWILLYEYIEDTLVLMLYKTGSHAHLKL